MRLSFDVDSRWLNVTNDTFKSAENQPLIIDLKKSNVAYELTEGESLTLIILPKGVSDTDKLVQQEITPNEYDDDRKVYALTFSAYTQPALTLLGIGNSTGLDDAADEKPVELVLVFRDAEGVETESFTAAAKLARSLNLPTSGAPGVVPAFSFERIGEAPYLRVYANGGLIGEVALNAPSN